MAVKKEKPKADLKNNKVEKRQKVTDSGVIGIHSQLGEITRDADEALRLNNRIWEGIETEVRTIDQVLGGVNEMT